MNEGKMKKNQYNHHAIKGYSIRMNRGVIF